MNLNIKIQNNDKKGCYCLDFQEKIDSVSSHSENIKRNC